MNWQNIVVGFSIAFVMVNALYPITTNIVKFVRDIRNNELKKENGMLKIKVQHLDECKENLQDKLKNVN